MFNGIYLQYPLALLLLLVFLVCDIYCKMRFSALYFPHARKFLQTTFSRSLLLRVVKWISIIALVVSLASPVRDEAHELDPKDGYEIALILDASQSMQAQGFDKANLELNRFDVVKSIVKDFIKERQDDNIGLIVFGQYSFIASPLTYDSNILNKIVSNLQIGMAGRYTALYESLAQGVNLFQTSKSKSKVAILLTDGHSTQGIDKIPLDVALDMAKKQKVKVYPIGIGLPHEYNQQVLTQIAKETGGVAFGASSASQLAEVYKKIDELEKSEIKNETLTYLKYYYHYPLVVALLSLLFYVYLRNAKGAV